MTILNRIASNWSFQEREKLNNNWAIIESYLSNLQGQVNILTGGVNVQDIVDQINNLLNQGNIVIADLEAALKDATTVITNAQNATTDATNAAQDALNAIKDMQAFIDQFGNAESYDNSKLYKVNNIVEFDGSGYICIQDTQGNPPPLQTKRNEWWQLFAQKGMDGTGSVSKVAGKSPDIEGNVSLSAEDIGAANNNEFDEHVTQSASETTKGHIELATIAETTAGTDNTRAVHPAGLKVELDKKVSKTQGSWVVGTLLNGWQGSVRFSTNELGVVTVDLNTYGGTVAKDTIICILPVGYRPARSFPIPATTDTFNIVNSAFYIDTGGNIKTGSALSAGVYHFALATFVSI